MSQPTYEDEQMRLEAEKCMRDGRFADAVALYRTLVAAHPGEESYPVSYTHLTLPTIYSV